MLFHSRITTYSLSLLLVMAGSWCSSKSTDALGAQPVPSRWFSIELYYHGQNQEEQKVAEWAEVELSQRPGTKLIRHDLDQHKASQQRLNQIAKFYKADGRQTPALYGCNQFHNDWANQQAFQIELQRLLRMDVFVRHGCPHCAAAKLYLKQLGSTYPGLEIVYHEITSEAGASAKVQELARQYRQGATSVPVFHFCRKLIVGFDEIAGTRQRIEKELERWSYPTKATENAKTSSFYVNRTGSMAMIPIPILLSDVLPSSLKDDESESPPLPLPSEELPLPYHLPLPGDDITDRPLDVRSEPDEALKTITLPVFGTLDLDQTGMPLFTIAIGLVDGFNPCAMWVLVFLLSILVNIKSRWRMLVIAGTFVLVSGIVYFMFMAAWLSLFMVVGLLRPVQIGLALMAIFVGSVHVKDFFAFKKGLTLSIPESAKPGIYARVRSVIQAEHLTGAMLSVIALAIMVNIVELLCTAGLPALYTEILTIQEYPAWENYAYLLLYNLAYMFDDSLMVLIVVVTMQKTRMQETQGRWLKLVSGIVILILGLVMLIKPDWLL